jgi:hypothetical protein
MISTLASFTVPELEVLCDVDIGNWWEATGPSIRANLRY